MLLVADEQNIVAWAFYARHGFRPLRAPPSVVPFDKNKPFKHELSRALWREAEGR